MDSRMCRAAWIVVACVVSATVLSPSLAGADGWSATGSLNVHRSHAVVVPLADGRVLAAGGNADWSWVTVVASAEIYDPATGEWTLTGSMNEPRLDAAAALLPDGRVLVAGGRGQSAERLSTAEVFDAVTGTWQIVGSMSYARDGWRAVPLPDGRVLVAGGALTDLQSSMSCEIFDPATQIWSLAAPGFPRTNHTVSLLQDGRVLVAGGYGNGGAVTEPQVYDPVSGVWTTTGPMLNQHYGHTAALLQDGKVLIAGGRLIDHSYTTAAEVFDPLTNLWTAAGALLNAHVGHATTVLPDGRALIIGGTDASASGADRVEIFDPVTASFSAGPLLPYTRTGHRAVLMQDDSVLVVGGSGDVCLRFTAQEDISGPTVALSSPADGATVSGSVLVAVMAEDDTGIQQVQIYDGASRIFWFLGPPYEMTWDTSVVAAGTHSLTARAYDTSGKSATSAPVTVTVADVKPPQVSILRPADGAAVSDVVEIEATASDVSGVDRVQFFLDAALIGSSSAPPYGISWDAGSAPAGSHILSARAYDPFGNVATSNYVHVTVGTVPPPTTASYDPQLGAPSCPAGPAECDSGTLLVGRNTLGPEPNQPNTLGTCTDGASGSFHLDESVDRIRILSSDGSPLAAEKDARVEVTVWAWSGYTSDKLDLYAAADATNPQWTLLATLTPAGAGQQVLAVTYKLPAGTRQAVRAHFRYGGAPAACGAGSYDDHDDLVFSLQAPAAQVAEAVYDPILRTPKCRAVGGACDSGALLRGRGPVAPEPEPHQPNTTREECADGSSGTFHLDGSIDRIRVSSTDGGPLAPGKTVRVNVTVWPRSLSDRVDVFYSTAAGWPAWTYAGSLTPVQIGEQVLSTTYVLPDEAHHVVRAVLRSAAAAPAVESCSTGPYDDHDDLWFRSSPGSSTATQWLHVGMVGSGNGSVVVSDDPPGTVCATAAGIWYPCDVEVDAGTTVELVARPDPGYVFAGWQGDCTGTGPCVVLMDQERHVSVEFVGPYSLVVNVAAVEGGLGRVTVAPVPANGAPPSCDVSPSPTSCTFTYAPGTIVRLAAEAQADSTFLGWTDSSCTGTGPCDVTVPSGGVFSSTVSAAFLGPRSLSVTLTSVEGGRGSLSATPPPVNGAGQCSHPGGSTPVTCTYLYRPGSSVVLSATPQSDSGFLGWSGACAGTAPCGIVLPGVPGALSVAVGAGYKGPRQLSVTVVSQDGSGRGAVALAPSSADGIGTCTLGSGDGTQKTCLLRYAPEKVVTLSPQPAAESAFVQWTGACTGNGPCGLTLSESSVVSATFKSSSPALLAAYDPQLRTPKCASVGAGCDSGPLLVGRGALGPEPNQPNTIGGSCSDGAYGAFHSDESADRIKVLSADGSPLTAGRTARVEVTVWAWAGYSSDKLDLYYAAGTTSPQWTLIGTLTPAVAGQQVLAATYTLPAGTLQAVRARFRYSGSAGPCGTGGYDDHDDLVFAVQ